MQEEIQAVQRIIDMIIDFVVRYSFQVAGAIIVLFVGWIVARAIASFVLKFLEKKKLDITLSKFIASTIKMISPKANRYQANTAKLWVDT